jgi:hypothetical protein
MTNTTQLLTLPFETLPESAKQIANQVYPALDRWIDARIDDLKARAEQELASETENLKSEFATLQQDLSARREAIKGFLDGVRKLADDIDLGDGQTLAEAVANTQKTLEAVHGELEMYEKRWRGVGENLVKRLAAVVTKVIA